MKKYKFKNGDVLHHYKKSLVLCFHGNRKVLSTGPNNGGYRTDLQAVFNYDANPGPGMGIRLNAPTYREHMDLFAEKDLGLDPSKVTGLMTAASMENASIKTLEYEDFSVTAIVTGGVKGNGGRAGDPASWHEREDKAWDIQDKASDDQEAKAGDDKEAKLIAEAPQIGTINILLHIDANLSEGALARSLVTCTEAKTAVLQELMVPSRYSTGPATGTGTDGVIVIADADSPVLLTNAGKHSKLGEFIGRTVKEALREALQKQQGLNPQKQHDILNRIDRYGVTEDTLWDFYKEWILCARKNQKSVEEVSMGNPEPAEGISLRNPESAEAASAETTSVKITSAETTSLKTGGPFLRAEFTDGLERLRKDPLIVTYTSLYVHLLDQLNWDLISSQEAEETGDALLKLMETVEKGEKSQADTWHEHDGREADASRNRVSNKADTEGNFTGNISDTGQNKRNTEKMMIKKYKTCMVSLVHHNTFVV